MDRTVPVERERKCRELGIEKLSLEPHPNQSVATLYEDTTEFARIKICWYVDDADRHHLYAKWIRRLTITCFLLGTLCPLIDNAHGLPLPVAPWGYVFIALGGGLFSFDRFGGLSWRWIRSTVIWVLLRGAYADFLHDWALLIQEAPDSSTEKCFKRLKDFRTKIEGIIAQECEDWAAMMNQRWLELLKHAQNLQPPPNKTPKGP